MVEDYGDACATVRFVIRDALAETAHISGLRAGDKSEAIVEAVFAKLHDQSTAWALKVILDKLAART